MPKRERHWIAGIAFTVVLIALIALATARDFSVFGPAVVAMVSAGAGAMFVMFPGSRFFSIALANFLGVYTCLYAFFLETNFEPSGPWALVGGYALPILGFLAGAWVRRDGIRSIVTSERMREERHLPRTFVWLVPVFAIGAATFSFPGIGLDTSTIELLLLACQGVIAAIVFAVSRDIAVFLLDTGLLFEEFFERIARLVLPAFAFFTFYSLIVIVFGALYRVIDRFSEMHHFSVMGQPQEIDFAQSLYFSLITLSTVGYGDIVPASPAIEVIVSIEIVFGVLLLLFGFSDILRYMREREGRG